MEASISIKFGDVFRYREKEYVFLVQTEEVIYAAKILDQENTERVQKLASRPRAMNITNQGNVAYSFIILHTADFRSRAAHLGNPGGAEHQISSFDLICTLDKEDVTNIKKEILEDGSTVPIELIELVKQLNV